MLYTTDQRLEMIEALKIVDEVYVFESVEGFIKENRVDFDIFAVGEDQTHEGIQRSIQWCEENGKKVIRLKRTPGISSSDIKGKVLK